MKLKRNGVPSRGHKRKKRKADPSQGVAGMGLLCALFKSSPEGPLSLTRAENAAKRYVVQYRCWPPERWNDQSAS